MAHPYGGNVKCVNLIRYVMPKQTDYLDLIERLKVPGYLDSLEHLFQKTERTKTIPLMIKKKIGLHDGKIWTYENIGNELGWVSNIKKKYGHDGTVLSRERVRQCIFKGYRIILRNEYLNERSLLDE